MNILFKKGKEKNQRKIGRQRFVLVPFDSRIKFSNFGFLHYFFPYHLMHNANKLKVMSLAGEGLPTEK